jgi:hypothetical protein
MPFDPTTAIADFEQRVADRIEAVKLTVFVCGPAITDASGVPSTEPGAAVRRYISDRIAEQGHSSVWGEHLPSKGGVGKVSLIRRFDDANREIMFADDGNTDLVVIFPTSSGSLAELGAFCMHDGISQKLLILFDKRYKRDDGFVVRALGKAARSRKATIRFTDYSRPKSVWAIVRRKIAEQRMNKSVRLSHA